MTWRCLLVVFMDEDEDEDEDEGLLQLYPHRNQIIRTHQQQYMTLTMTWMPM